MPRCLTRCFQPISNVICCEIGKDTYRNEVWTRIHASQMILWNSQNVLSVNFSITSMCLFKHWYLRSRASKCLSLSSASSIWWLLTQILTLSRYSCLYLGSRIHEFWKNLSWGKEEFVSWIFLMNTKYFRVGATHVGLGKVESLFLSVWPLQTHALKTDA